MRPASTLQDALSESQASSTGIIDTDQLRAYLQRRAKIDLAPRGPAPLPPAQAQPLRNSPAIKPSPDMTAAWQRATGLGPMLDEASTALNRFVQENPTFFIDMASGTGPGGAMMGGVRRGVSQLRGMASKMAREGGMLPEGQGVGSELFEMGGPTSGPTRQVADRMTLLTDAMDRAKMRVHTDIINHLGITPEKMQRVNSKSYNEMLGQNLMLEVMQRSPEEAQAIYEASAHWMENIAPLMARMRKN